MSLLYKIAKPIVRLSGMKKMFKQPKDDLLHMAEKRNRKRGFSMPTDKNLDMPMSLFQVNIIV